MNEILLLYIHILNTFFFLSNLPYQIIQDFSIFLFCSNLTIYKIYGLQSFSRKRLSLHLIALAFRNWAPIPAHEREDERMDEYQATEKLRYNTLKVIYKQLNGKTRVCSKTQTNSHQR